MIDTISYCDECATKHKLPTSALVKSGKCELCNRNAIIQVVPKDKIPQLAKIQETIIQNNENIIIAQFKKRCTKENLQRFETLLDYIKDKVSEDEIPIIIEKISPAIFSKDYDIEKLKSLADKFIMVKKIIQKD